MSGTTQGMDSNSSKGVSAFDLEPNPFEQSFASTKKPVASGFVPQRDNSSVDSKPVDGTGLVSTRINLSLNGGGAAGSGAINATMGGSGVERQLDGTEKSKIASFVHGAQRPAITSPPVSTPGGGNRLPPILLSPTFIQHGAINGNHLNEVAGHHQIGGTLPNSVSPTANISSGATTAESLKSGYFLSMPKTGLTPNESNLRAGLTPVLGVVNTLSHPPFANLPSFSNLKPEASYNEMKNHHEQKPILHTGLSGSFITNATESAPFTSGLGSILGLNSNIATSQANTNSTRSGISEYENLNTVQASSSENHGTDKNQKKEADTLESVDSTRSSNKSRQRKSSNTMSPRQTTTRKRKSSASHKGVRSNKKQQMNAVDPDEAEEATRNINEDNSENYDGEEGQERKRKEFLERNRVAASKFRKRKKEYIKKVEVDLKFYQSEYEDMSQAIDKLCGIVQDSPNPIPSNSLLSMLETSIAKNDAPSSISILAHIQQVLHETAYFQRNGKNPRRESGVQDSDDEERLTCFDKGRSRQASASSGSRVRKNSFDNYSGNGLGSSLVSTQPVSRGSNASFGTDTTTMSSSSKNEAATESLMPLSLDNMNEKPARQVASAIGTISTLPDVINGTQVIPLNSVSKKSVSNASTFSEIKQSSLVDLTSAPDKLARESAKYPNST